MIPLYQRLAATIQDRQSCIAAGNKDWQERHEAAAFALVQEHMPSGSGIDSGVNLILEDSHIGESDYEEAIVFRFGYHPLNEHGFYLAWQHYELRVRPAFLGVGLSLIRLDDDGGDDDKEIDQEHLSDYLLELMQDYLTRDV